MQTPRRFTRRAVLIAMAIVLGIAATATGGTLAYFTSQDTKKNDIKTPDAGDVVVYEVFEKPDEWLPGMAVTKRVGAANVGTVPVLVRIGLEERIDKLSGAVQGFSAPLSGTQIPATVDASKYTAANKWYAPAALPADPAHGIVPLTVDAAINTALGAAAAATLKVKVTVLNEGTAAESLAYSFVYWYPITSGTYSGKNQSARADFYVDGTTVKLVASSQKFYAYPGFAAKKEFAWANLKTKQSGAVFGTPRPVADIGKSAVDNLILLAYDQTAATPTTSKWYYNPADGFFYYIGVVAPGSISPLLLDHVTLDSSAGSAYSNMSYDLCVTVEAIQVSKDAITSTSGWGLATTSNVVTKLAADGAFA